MPNKLELVRWLASWQRREALVQGLAGAVRGLALGLGLAALWSLAALPLGQTTPLEYLRGAAALALGFSLVLGAGNGLVQRSPLKAARRFDHLFALRERLSTALELVEKDEDSLNSLERRQVADALAHARQVDAHRALPLRIPRLEALSAALLLLLALLPLAWGRPYFEAAQGQRRFEQSVQAQAVHLEALAAQVRQDPALSPQARDRVAASLEQAAGQLRQAQTPEQAVSALSEPAQILQALDSPGARERLQALRQAGQALQSQPGPLDKERSLGPVGEQLAQGDPAAAARSLQGLDPAGISPTERQAMADQLRQAAGSLEASDPALAGDLQSAAQALQAGDPGAARQALQSAAGKLGAAGQQAAQAQAARGLAGGIAESQAQLAQAGGRAPGTGQPGNPSNSASGQADAGAGQAGAGNQAGLGANQNPSAGAGNAGGAGRGTGNNQNGAGPQAGQAPIDTHNGPGNGGETPYQQIFAPQRLGGSGGPELNLPPGAAAGDQSAGVQAPAPGQPGASQVPYINVLPAYQQAYRQAAQNGQIPAQLRDLVRKYFSSLEPLIQSNP